MSSKTEVLTNLAITAEYSVESHWTEEHEWYCNFNNKSGGHTKTMPPVREEEEQPSQGCWDTLGLIVKGQRCGVRRDSHDNIKTFYSCSSLCSPTSPEITSISLLSIYPFTGKCRNCIIFSL